MVVAALAARQYGLISRTQALEAGLDEHAIDWRLRSKQWLRVHRSVYRLASHLPSWEQRALAICLLGGADAHLSHLTAAWLHGLDGIERPEVIDVTTPTGRRLHVPGVRHHQSLLHPRRAAKVRSLPVTNLAWTLFDLASCVSTEVLELALDSAHRRKRGLDRWLKTILATFDEARLPRGAVQIASLLNERLGHTESALERRVRARLRNAGIAAWVEQQRIFDASGFVARADFGWPAHRVALFVDSYRWHAAGPRLDHDATQRNRLLLAGWEFLVVTHRMLGTTLWLEQLTTMLRRRTPQLTLSGFT